MFSLRIVTTDYYLAAPLRNLDVCFSDFRGTEAKKVPVFRIYGSTPAGQKTCMHVHGVFPYVFVPYDGTQPSDKFIRQFASSIDKALNVALGNASSMTQHVFKISIVSGIPFYGYHPKDQEFLKIYLYNPAMVKKVADLLLGGAVMNKIYQPHEAHVPYSLQLFMDYNLYGMNMINVAAAKFRRQKEEKCRTFHQSPGRRSSQSAPGTPATPSSLMSPGTPGSIMSPGTPSTVLSITEMHNRSHQTCRWDQENIPNNMLMDADVPRMSTCELEVDVVAADIQNRLEIEGHAGTNPGLMAIWEDEKERRREKGEMSQIENPKSQDRGDVPSTDSEDRLQKYVQNIIMEQQQQIPKDDDYDSQRELEEEEWEVIESQGRSNTRRRRRRSSHDRRSPARLPLTPPSSIESPSHQSLDDSQASDQTVIVDESCPVIDVDSIHRVVSSSQSFQSSQTTSSQQPIMDSQDKALAELLACLTEQPAPDSPEMTSLAMTQVSVLEEQDSILGSNPARDDNEDDIISIEMSQRLWSDPEEEAKEKEILDKSPNFEDDLLGMDQSWSGSQWLDLDTTPVPQYDGAGDENNEKSVPTKKRLGIRGPVLPMETPPAISHESAGMSTPSRPNMTPHISSGDFSLIDELPMLTPMTDLSTWPPSPFRVPESKNNNSGGQSDRKDSEDRNIVPGSGRQDEKDKTCEPEKTVNQALQPPASPMQGRDSVNAPKSPWNSNNTPVHGGPSLHNSITSSTAAGSANNKPSMPSSPFAPETVSTANPSVNVDTANLSLDPFDERLNSPKKSGPMTPQTPGHSAAVTGDSTTDYQINTPFKRFTEAIQTFETEAVTKNLPSPQNSANMHNSGASNNFEPQGNVPHHSHQQQGVVAQSSSPPGTQLLEIGRIQGKRDNQGNQPQQTNQQMGQKCDQLHASKLGKRRANLNQGDEQRNRNLLLNELNAPGPVGMYGSPACPPEMGNDMNFQEQPMIGYQVQDPLQPDPGVFDDSPIRLAWNVAMAATVDLEQLEANQREELKMKQQKQHQTVISRLENFVNSKDTSKKSSKTSSSKERKKNQSKDALQNRPREPMMHPQMPNPFQHPPVGQGHPGFMRGVPPMPFHHHPEHFMPPNNFPMMPQPGMNMPLMREQNAMFHQNFPPQMPMNRAQVPLNEPFRPPFPNQHPGMHWPNQHRHPSFPMQMNYPAPPHPQHVELQHNFSLLSPTDTRPPQEFPKAVHNQNTTSQNYFPESVPRSTPNQLHRNTSVPPRNDRPGQSQSNMIDLDHDLDLEILPDITPRDQGIRASVNTVRRLDEKKSTASRTPGSSSSSRPSSMQPQVTATTSVSSSAAKSSRASSTQVLKTCTAPLQSGSLQTNPTPMQPLHIVPPNDNGQFQNLNQSMQNQAQVPPRTTATVSQDMPTLPQMSACLLSPTEDTFVPEGVDDTTNIQEWIIEESLNQAKAHTLSAENGTSTGPSNDTIQRSQNVNQEHGNSHQQGENLVRQSEKSQKGGENFRGHTSESRLSFPEQLVPPSRTQNVQEDPVIQAGGATRQQQVSSGESYSQSHGQTSNSGQLQPPLSRNETNLTDTGKTDTWEPPPMYSHERSSRSQTTSSQSCSNSMISRGRSHETIRCISQPVSASQSQVDTMVGSRNEMSNYSSRSAPDEFSGPRRHADSIASSHETCTYSTKGTASQGRPPSSQRQVDNMASSNETSTYSTWTTQSQSRPHGSQRHNNGVAVSHQESNYPRNYPPQRHDDSHAGSSMSSHNSKIRHSAGQNQPSENVTCTSYGQSKVPHRNTDSGNRTMASRRDDSPPQNDEEHLEEVEGNLLAEMNVNRRRWEDRQKQRGQDFHQSTEHGGMEQNRESRDYAKSAQVRQEKQPARDPMPCPVQKKATNRYQNPMMPVRSPTSRVGRPILRRKDPLYVYGNKNSPRSYNDPVSKYSELASGDDPNDEDYNPTDVTDEIDYDEANHKKFTRKRRQAYIGSYCENTLSQTIEEVVEESSRSIPTRPTFTPPVSQASSRGRGKSKRRGRGRGKGKGRSRSKSKSPAKAKGRSTKHVNNTDLKDKRKSQQKSFSDLLDELEKQTDPVPAVHIVAPVYTTYRTFHRYPSHAHKGYNVYENRWKHPLSGLEHSHYSPTSSEELPVFNSKGTKRNYAREWRDHNAEVNYDSLIRKNTQSIAVDYSDNDADYIDNTGCDDFLPDLLPQPKKSSKKKTTGKDIFTSSSYSSRASTAKKSPTSRLSSKNKARLSKLKTKNSYTCDMAVQCDGLPSHEPAFVPCPSFVDSPSSPEVDYTATKSKRNKQLLKKRKSESDLYAQMSDDSLDEGADQTWRSKSFKNCVDKTVPKSPCKLVLSKSSTNGKWQVDSLGFDGYNSEKSKSKSVPSSPKKNLGSQFSTFPWIKGYKLPSTKYKNRGHFDLKTYGQVFPHVFKPSETVLFTCDSVVNYYKGRATKSVDRKTRGMDTVRNVVKILAKDKERYDFSKIGKEAVMVKKLPKRLVRHYLEKDRVQKSTTNVYQQSYKVSSHKDDWSSVQSTKSVYTHTEYEHLNRVTQDRSMNYDYPLSTNPQDQNAYYEIRDTDNELGYDGYDDVIFHDEELDDVPSVPAIEPPQNRHPHKKVVLSKQQRKDAQYLDDDLWSISTGSPGTVRGHGDGRRSAQSDGRSTNYQKRMSGNELSSFDRLQDDFSQHRNRNDGNYETGYEYSDQYIEARDSDYRNVYNKANSRKSSGKRRPDPLSFVQNEPEYCDSDDVVIQDINMSLASPPAEHDTRDMYQSSNTNNYENLQENDINQRGANRQSRSRKDYTEQYCNSQRERNYHADHDRNYENEYDIAESEGSIAPPGMATLDDVYVDIASVEPPESEPDDLKDRYKHVLGDKELAVESVKLEDVYPTVFPEGVDPDVLQTEKAVFCKEINGEVRLKVVDRKSIVEDEESEDSQPMYRNFVDLINAERERASSESPKKDRLSLRNKSQPSPRKQVLEFVTSPPGKSISEAGSVWSESGSELAGCKRSPKKKRNRSMNPFCRPSRKLSRNSNSSVSPKVQKIQNSLNALHEATVEGLKCEQYNDQTDDYRSIYSDVMFKFALYSPPPSDLGEETPPMPLSPEQIHMENGDENEIERKQQQCPESEFSTRVVLSSVSSSVEVYSEGSLSFIIEENVSEPGNDSEHERASPSSIKNHQHGEAWVDPTRCRNVEGSNPYPPLERNDYSHSEDTQNSSHSLAPAMTEKPDMSPPNLGPPITVPYVLQDNSRSPPLLIRHGSPRVSHPTHYVTGSRRGHEDGQFMDADATDIEEGASQICSTLNGSVDLFKDSDASLILNQEEQDQVLNEIAKYAETPVCKIMNVVSFAQKKEMITDENEKAVIESMIPEVHPLDETEDIEEALSEENRTSGVEKGVPEPTESSQQNDQELVPKNVMEKCRIASRYWLKSRSDSIESYTSDECSVAGQVQVVAASPKQDAELPKIAVKVKDAISYWLQRKSSCSGSETEVTSSERESIVQSRFVAQAEKMVEKNTTENTDTTRNEQDAGQVKEADECSNATTGVFSEGPFDEPVEEHCADDDLSSSEESSCHSDSNRNTPISVCSSRFSDRSSAGHWSVTSSHSSLSDPSSIPTIKLTRQPDPPRATAVNDENDDDDVFVEPDGKAGTTSMKPDTVLLSSSSESHSTKDPEAKSKVWKDINDLSDDEPAGKSPDGPQYRLELCSVSEPPAKVHPTPLPPQPPSRHSSASETAVLETEDEGDQENSILSTIASDSSREGENFDESLRRLESLQETLEKVGLNILKYSPSPRPLPFKTHEDIKKTTDLLKSLEAGHKNLDYHSLSILLGGHQKLITQNEQDEGNESVEVVQAPRAKDIAAESPKQEVQIVSEIENETAETGEMSESDAVSDTEESADPKVLSETAKPIAPVPLPAQPIENIGQKSDHVEEESSPMNATDEESINEEDTGTTERTNPVTIQNNESRSCSTILKVPVVVRSNPVAYLQGQEGEERTPNEPDETKIEPSEELWNVAPVILPEDDEISVDNGSVETITKVSEKSDASSDVDEREVENGKMSGELNSSVVTPLPLPGKPVDFGGNEGHDSDDLASSTEPEDETSPGSCIPLAQSPEMPAERDTEKLTPVCKPHPALQLLMEDEDMLGADVSSSVGSPLNRERTPVGSLLNQEGTPTTDEETIVSRGKIEEEEESDASEVDVLVAAAASASSPPSCNESEPIFQEGEESLFSDPERDGDLGAQEAEIEDTVEDGDVGDKRAAVSDLKCMEGDRLLTSDLGEAPDIETREEGHHDKAIESDDIHEVVEESLISGNEMDSDHPASLADFSRNDELGGKEQNERNGAECYPVHEEGEQSLITDVDKYSKIVALQTEMEEDVAERQKDFGRTDELVGEDQNERNSSQCDLIHDEGEQSFITDADSEVAAPLNEKEEDGADRQQDLVKTDELVEEHNKRNGAECDPLHEEVEQSLITDTDEDSEVGTPWTGIEEDVAERQKDFVRTDELVGEEQNERNKSECDLTHDEGEQSFITDADSEVVASLNEKEEDGTERQQDFVNTDELVGEEQNERNGEECDPLHEEVEQSLITDTDEDSEVGTPWTEVEEDVAERQRDFVRTERNRSDDEGEQSFITDAVNDSDVFAHPTEIEENGAERPEEIIHKSEFMLDETAEESEVLEREESFISDTDLRTLLPAIEKTCEIELGGICEKSTDISQEEGRIDALSPVSKSTVEGTETDDFVERETAVENVEQRRMDEGTENEAIKVSDVIVEEGQIPQEPVIVAEEVMHTVPELVPYCSNVDEEDEAILTDLEELPSFVASSAIPLASVSEYGSFSEEGTVFTSMEGRLAVLESTESQLCCIPDLNNLAEEEEVFTSNSPACPLMMGQHDSSSDLSNELETDEPPIYAEPISCATGAVPDLNNLAKEEEVLGTESETVLTDYEDQGELGPICATPNPHFEHRDSEEDEPIIIAAPVARPPTAAFHLVDYNEDEETETEEDAKSESPPIVAPIAGPPGPDFRGFAENQEMLYTDSDIDTPQQRLHNAQDQGEVTSDISAPAQVNPSTDTSAEDEDDCLYYDVPTPTQDEPPTPERESQEDLESYISPVSVYKSRLSSVGAMSIMSSQSCLDYDGDIEHGYNSDDTSKGQLSSQESVEHLNYEVRHTEAGIVVRPRSRETSTAESFEYIVSGTRSRRRTSSSSSVVILEENLNADEVDPESFEEVISSEDDDETVRIVEKQRREAWIAANGLGIAHNSDGSNLENTQRAHLNLGKNLVEESPAPVITKVQRPEESCGVADHVDGNSEEKNLEGDYSESKELDKTNADPEEQCVFRTRFASEGFSVNLDSTADVTSSSNHQINAYATEQCSESELESEEKWDNLELGSSELEDKQVDLHESDIVDMRSSDEEILVDQVVSDSAEISDSDQLLQCQKNENEVELESDNQDAESSCPIKETQNDTHADQVALSESGAELDVDEHYENSDDAGTDDEASSHVRIEDPEGSTPAASPKTLLDSQCDSSESERLSDEEVTGTDDLNLHITPSFQTAESVDESYQDLSETEAGLGSCWEGKSEYDQQHCVIEKEKEEPTASSEGETSDIETDLPENNIRPSEEVITPSQHCYDESKDIFQEDDVDLSLSPTDGAGGQDSEASEDEHGNGSNNEPERDGDSEPESVDCSETDDEDYLNLHMSSSDTTADEEDLLAAEKVLDESDGGSEREIDTSAITPGQDFHKRQELGSPRFHDESDEEGLQNVSRCPSPEQDYDSESLMSPVMPTLDHRPPSPTNSEHSMRSLSPEIPNLDCSVASAHESMRSSPEKPMLELEASLDEYDVISLPFNPCHMQNSPFDEPVGSPASSCTSEEIPNYDYTAAARSRFSTAKTVRTPESSPELPNMDRRIHVKPHATDEVQLSTCTLKSQEFERSSTEDCVDHATGDSVNFSDDVCKVENGIIRKESPVRERNESTQEVRRYQVSSKLLNKSQDNDSMVKQDGESTRRRSSSATSLSDAVIDEDKFECDKRETVVESYEGLSKSLYDSQMSLFSSIQSNRHSIDSRKTSNESSTPPSKGSVSFIDDSGSSYRSNPTAAEVLASKIDPRNHPSDDDFNSDLEIDVVGLDDDDMDDDIFIDDEADDPAGGSRQAAIYPSQNSKLRPGRGESDPMRPPDRHQSLPSPESGRSRSSSDDDSLGDDGDDPDDLESLPIKIMTPLLAPPSRRKVVEDMKNRTFATVHYREPFYGNKADVPTNVMDVGGRLLKVKATSISQLKEFESFNPYSNANGLKNWQMLLASGDDNMSEDRGFNLLQELDKNPQLKAGIMGRGKIVMTPCKMPPKSSSVQLWLEKKIHERKLLEEKKLAEAREANAEDVVVRELSYGDLREDPDRDVTREDAGQEVKDEETGESQHIVRKDRRVSFEVETHSQVSKVDDSPPQELERNKDPDETHSRSTVHVVHLKRTRSLDLTFHHEERKEKDIISPPPKCRRLSRWDQSSPAYRRTRSEEDIPQHSTPIRRAFSDMPYPGYTPIHGHEEMDTDEAAHGSPSDGLQKPSLKRRHCESLRKAVLASQAKSLFATPKRRLSDMSLIEGPTPPNTCGFKVSQHDLADAKALHERQFLTIISIELHCRTRGDLRPDPEFDPICGIFYHIFDDTSEDLHQRERTGVFILNDRGTTPRPSTSKRSPQTIPTDRTSLQRSGIWKLDTTYVNTEQEMLDEFVEFILRLDPDILVGYEIQMSSWGYLLQRGAQLNINVCAKISRLPDSPKESSFSSAKDEWGADYNSEIHIAGRVVLNLWRLLRHEVTLNVYSFENIAYHVLHQRIPLFTFRTLTSWFDHKTDLYRWRTVEHYVLRAKANIKILNQLDLVGRTSEFARVFGIEFYHVLSRGSQYRVESMMLRMAKPMNYIAVSPSVQQRARMKAPEVIPLTMEPESRFYSDPVVLLDFQSLYPSIMIAYNYCYSTCIGRVEHIANAENGEYEFGCTSLRISPDVLKDPKKNLYISPLGIAFVKQHVRKGVVPKMVEDILETRIMVKRAMKENKDNAALKRILDARQLGLKLIANVTYGYTAASFSGRMPCIEVGDSVVSKARETLERAIKLVEENEEWGAQVVYGDTDSMFILLKGRSKEDAFRIGYEMCEAVTKDNPKPVKLKFEKVYLPCILQTKKRYAGYMYETLDQKEPVYDAKGIETVRRDACPSVSKILEKSLKCLFSTKDVSQVKQYVTRQCRKLMEGRIPIQDLTFAKEYRGIHGYRPGACVPALEISKKRLASDRRSEPRVGERVPYVIVYGQPGLPLIQLVRQPMEVLQDPSLRINAVYYITKQVLPPLNRAFSLMGVDVFSWYHDMPKIMRLIPSSVQEGNKQGTLSKYFNTMSCPVCDELTSQGLCDKCKKDPQTSVIIINNRIRDWERTHQHLSQMCYMCMGCNDPKLGCVSLDCPVLYRFVKVTRDLTQSQKLREIQQKLDF